MGAKSAAQVIIRRKKSGQAGEQHHGGAWKVAYADFVTAMMAFFLLMWLLNATTEKQRKGLADYFNPTIAVNRISGGGTAALYGDSTFKEDSLAQSGEGGNPGDAAGQRSMDEETLQEVSRQLSAQSGASMIEDRLLRHIGTRMTDEGLVIELFDLPEAPLFQGDTDQPSLLLEELAAALARVLAEVPQAIAVTGHVRSYPVVWADQPAWTLSWQRASKLRQLLGGAGLDDQRFQRVTGKADRDPAAKIPTALRNNRLELVLLRGRAAAEDKDNLKSPVSH